VAAILPLNPGDGDRTGGNKSRRARPQKSPRPLRDEQEELPVIESVADFRHAHRAVKSTPDARAARVAALRARVRSGTYHPDPEAIARRIIEQGF